MTTLAGFVPFNYPSGVSVDSNGAVFVADTGNHRIRMVTSSGVCLDMLHIAFPWHPPCSMYRLGLLVVNGNGKFIQKWNRTKFTFLLEIIETTLPHIVESNIFKGTLEAIVYFRLEKSA